MTLPDNLIEKWDEAERTGEADVGRIVVCDFCDADYTDSTAPGGLLFGSKAVCPTCALRIERRVIDFGEERFIRARCVPGMAFSDWVRELRNLRGPGGNKIRIVKR